MSRKFETQGFQYYCVKWIKTIFADKENSWTKTRGSSLLPQSSSHFFNKTDLEQRLFSFDHQKKM